MTRWNAMLIRVLTMILPVLGPLSNRLTDAAEPQFERIVIDDDFPGGYQVEVADVNGDGKPDLVALGGSTVAWYENPSWTKRIITTREQAPDVISSAAIDLDGDGRAEVAIAYDFAMNEPKRGKLGLAVQGGSPDDPWTFRHVADVPSIHRVRWGDIDWDGKPDLVAAPIFGPDTTPPDYHSDPARLVFFRLGDDPISGPWTVHLATRRPVIHAIEILIDDGKASILTADNEGVLSVGGWSMIGGHRSLFQMVFVPGAPGEAPNRGCSEVHYGGLSDGRALLATIEPWHGNQVVIYDNIPHERSFAKGPRTVIDDTLDAGHALWLADVDGDGDDEVFAGHRGKDHRVSVYDLDRATGRWERTVIDRGIAAQDLRGGDLDGDGTPDVVAIGGSTHNVVWYRPLRERSEAPRDANP